ncbi:MAG TPA: type VI secretion system tube protein Hcp [Acidisphaera sp.]|nr:type VI secretion system tube protein Hcp [Acidisphaera sp.]
MAEDARDILMKLEITEGNCVDAECSAVIEASPTLGVKDALADGFEHQSLVGGAQVNYFAIDDFTFPVGLKPDSEPDKLAEALNKHLASQGKDKVPTKSEFTRFMEGGHAGISGKQSYPANLDQMSIIKKLDVSSTGIFRLCKESKTLFGASILKRKAIGGDSLRGYLRIDFFEVLITDLGWDNADVVKEDFKFVCRKATVRYCMETLTTDLRPRSLPKLVQIAEETWSVLHLDK